MDTAHIFNFILLLIALVAFGIVAVTAVPSRWLGVGLMALVLSMLILGYSGMGGQHVIG